MQNKNPQTKKKKSKKKKKKSATPVLPVLPLTFGSPVPPKNHAQVKAHSLHPSVEQKTLPPRGANSLMQRLEDAMEGADVVSIMFRFV